MAKKRKLPKVHIEGKGNRMVAVVRIPAGTDKKMRQQRLDEAERKAAEVKVDRVWKGQTSLF
jgi:hypothetical protein